MKCVAVLLLVCLLVAGTASAIKINPASVGGSKAVVTFTTSPAAVRPMLTTSPPSVAVNPSIMNQSVAVSEIGGVKYVFTSNIPHSTVWINSVPSGTTPRNVTLAPGHYYLQVNFPGYSTINREEYVTAGMPTQFVAVVLVPLGIDPLLNINSTPGGATVTLDNNTSVSGTTPFHMDPEPGYHTFQIHLESYKDVNGFITIEAGIPQYMNINLEPVNGTLMSRTPSISGHIKGELTRITINPVPVTTTPTITMVCPNADWSCLTEDEAAQQFGYPNARYGDAPCGYAQKNGQTVNKFCFMDVDSGGKLPANALIAGSIRDGDNIYIINQTWVEHAVVNKSPVVQETEPATPIQSIFNFFNNVFGGGKITPETRLQRIGLNPQPEPPAQDPQVQNAK